MPRTESKTFQCHPNDAQEQINFHQQFHWSLISSQDVKTVDNSLEKRGDTVYSVRQSEHYVKLTFSRDLDAPNIHEIKKLESAYNALREPVRKELKYPKDHKDIIFVGMWVSIIPFPVVVFFMSSFVIGIVVSIIVFVLANVLYYCGFASHDRAVKEAYDKEFQRSAQEHRQNLQNYAEERRRILSEVKKYN